MRLPLRSYAARRGVYFGIQRIICYLGYLVSQCRHDELYRCRRSCPCTKKAPVLPDLDSFGMATYIYRIQRCSICDGSRTRGVVAVRDIHLTARPSRTNRTKTVAVSLSLSIMPMPMPRNGCGDMSNSKLAWLGTKGLERDSPRSQAQRRLPADSAALGLGLDG